MLKIEKHGTTESNIYIYKMCCARSPNRSHRLFCCHREVKYTPFSLTFHDLVAEGSTQFASVVSITIIFHEQTAAAHRERKNPVTNEKRRSLHWSFWFWLEHLAKEFLCCAHFHLMWAHVFWKIICFVRNSGSPSTGFAFFSPLNPCFVQSIKIFTWFFYVPPSLWFAAHGFLSFRSLINNLLNCFNSIESSKITFIWNDFVWFLCSLSLTCVWLCDNIQSIRSSSFLD